MNWQAISFDWNQARGFLATAEEGSLSAAARALGQTQPTLGRQITALEQSLGVALFERVGRGLVLTDAGADLLVHMRAMADAASKVSLAASGQSQDVSGVVRISASDIFAAKLLPPVLDILRHMAPKITIEVVATNDISDLLRREADIAIRHVRPEEPDLIARLIHEAKAEFFASTAYLERRGRPQTLADLSAHEFVSFGNVVEMMGHLEAMGVSVTPENFKTGSSNMLVAWEFVQRGFGVAVMSSAVGRKSPGIEPLFQEIGTVHFPVWLVTHRELHTARRIRLVFDVLAEQFPKLMT